MKKILLISLVSFSCFALTGCEETKYPKYAIDQEKRTPLFQACMEQIPQGPQSVKYNDWDEVVYACNSISESQSKYCYENCPPSPIKKEDQ